jgi:rubredoxin
MNMMSELDAVVGTRKWICLVCDYIYDEAKGCPEDGIAPGTPFEAIPDTWACPDCGVTKADFEPYTE